MAYSRIPNKPTNVRDLTQRSYYDMPQIKSGDMFGYDIMSQLPVPRPLARHSHDDFEYNIHLGKET
jgi:hypothetical protein